MKLIATIVVTLTLSSDQPDRVLSVRQSPNEPVAEAPHEEAAGEEDDPAHRAKPIGDPAVASEENQSPCGPSEHRVDDDLCQQWRMAEGTEKLARAADGQLTATWISIVAQFLAAAAATWAAFAASSAARAAKEAAEATEKSVSVAEKSLIESVRPYLAITNARKVRVLQTNEAPSVNLLISNTGNAPAIVEEGFSELRLIRPGESLPLPTRLNPMHRRPLGAGYFVLTAGTAPVHFPAMADFAFTSEDIRQIRTGEAVLYLLGYARYRSPLGTRRECGFCLQFHSPGVGQRGTGGFSVLRDSKRNYDRKIDV